MAFITPWFPKAKLGIFVHWGVFTVMTTDELNRDPSTTDHQRSMSLDESRKRGQLLTCDKFDMDEWARMFTRWGAKYAVLTARHAAGFPLWDTKIEPERSIMNMSPYGKDIVAEWCRGLRAADLKVGIYMGHRDWGDPDFCAEMDNEPYREPDPAKRDAAWARYIEKRNAKLQELMANYGEIDQLWMDESWGSTGERLASEDILDIALRNNPRIVINNRLGLPYGGMHNNPEQNVPVVMAKPGTAPFEVCDTLRDAIHWQYIENSPEPLRRKEDILRYFIDTITHGGNYLINIGPDYSGVIPQEEVEILDYLGDFCQRNAEAIYDTSCGIERHFYGGGSTQKPGAIYLFAVDRGRPEIVMRGVRNPILGVTRVDSGAPVPFRQAGGRPSHNAPPYTFIDTSADHDPQPVVYKVSYSGKLDLCPW